MNFNNGFPIGYQPYYPPIVQPQPQVAPQPQSNINWVQGEAGAKAHQVGPNSVVPLWDSESQTIYIKSTNAVGVPTITVLDYTIRDTTPKIASEGVRYATQDDVNTLRQEIETLRMRLEPIREENKNA